MKQKTLMRYIAEAILILAMLGIGYYLTVALMVGKVW